MQVHGAHTGLTPSGNWTHAKSADASSAAAIASSADHKRTDGGGLVAILQTRLAHLPEVRADRIEQVRSALANGEYLTRTAAEATAQAILKGNV